MPDIWVIFISKFDIFNGGFPLYHIDRIVRETGKSVDNGFNEVYVNAKVKDDSEISELMEVFMEDNAYSNKFPITSSIKRQYKETGGLQAMCEIMERIREEGKEGRKEGWEEAASRINKINSILLKSKRFNDLERSMSDPQYQEQLMAAFSMLGKYLHTKKELGIALTTFPVLFGYSQLFMRKSSTSS